MRTPRPDLVPRTQPLYDYIQERRKETRASPTKSASAKQRAPTQEAANEASPSSTFDEGDTCGMVFSLEDLEAIAEQPEANAASADIDFATSGLVAELWTGHCVRVPKALGEVCRDGNEQLVLAQLVYWFGRTKQGELRATRYREDYYWVAKTYEGLAEEVGLEARQVRHAVSKLVERGVLVKEGGLFAGKRCVYLRIRTEAIAKCLPQAELKVTKSHRPKRDRVK